MGRSERNRSYQEIENIANIDNAENDGSVSGSPRSRRRAGRRRIRGKIILILVMLAVIAGAAGYLMRYIDQNLRYTEGYAAGNKPDVNLYLFSYEAGADDQATAGDETASSDKTVENDQGADGDKTAADGQVSGAKPVKAGTITRGTQVRLYKKRIESGGDVYIRIKADRDSVKRTDGLAGENGQLSGYEEYYVKEASAVSSPEECVLEKKIYPRTPATIYTEEDGPAIEGFAPKAAELKVTGYDGLRSDGSVNKYRITYTDSDKVTEGYVYGKYMSSSRKAAGKNYNANGIYDKAKGDNYYFDLHGGAAKNLDYYPYERTPIEGNEFLARARAMYINAAAAVNPDEYVKLIQKTDCNAVVIDIKDGPLAYKSEVAKELSETSYKNAYASEEDYRKGIDAYRDAGVYLIGRIVTFNDPYYAADHPKDCIKYGGQSSWPTAYSRNVWEYNVRLAIEAVQKFGFNEIQFDYVRFPEASYDMSISGKADFRNRYGEEKGQAIQNFCFYAADQLRENDAYMSVDVFGESAYGYMTAYGQYWAGLANIADAISAMPYTDHTGGEGAWKKPYETMYTWAKRAAAQQSALENPAAARTWITGYDTPYWNPEVNYNAARLKEQIKGLEDAGLEGGFIPWNVLSSLKKYNQYKAIWKEE